MKKNQQDKVLLAEWLRVLSATISGWVGTFKQKEWLKAVEIGWTPSPDRPMTDRIQFTYWDKDPLVQSDILKGQS